MSEYTAIRTQKPRSIDELDNTGTLFDTADYGDELDRIVDTQHISYQQARARLGIEEPKAVLSAPVHEQVSYAVSVDDRAVALESIMAYLNKANQTNGSKIHIENGGERMIGHYGYPAIYDVQQGAEGNRDKLRQGFLNGINVLAASEQMRALGFGEDEIEHERMKMQMSINAEFGVGNAYAPARNKVAKSARRSADMVSGRKKPRRRR